MIVFWVVIKFVHAFNQAIQSVINDSCQTRRFELFGSDIYKEVEGLARFVIYISFCELVGFSELQLLQEWVLIENETGHE